MMADSWRRTAPFALALIDVQMKPMKRAIMQAKVGDQIVISGHRVGESNRNCEVLELRHPNGEPPYLVRWEDTGDEDLF